MLKIFKKNNSLLKFKTNKGFALLFSVLISSLLLTIGLSIFSIALKELAISTNIRQSIHAFYAADSGREYVLYKDLITGDAINGFNINDLDQEAVSEQLPESNFILVDDGDLSGPNFYVNIKKEWADGEKTKINTTITSYGHDSTSGDRVERAISQSY